MSIFFIYYTERNIHGTVLYNGMHGVLGTELKSKAIEWFYYRMTTGFILFILTQHNELNIKLSNETRAGSSL